MRFYRHDGLIAMRHHAGASCEANKRTSLELSCAHESGPCHLEADGPEHLNRLAADRQEDVRRRISGRTPGVNKPPAADRLLPARVAGSRRRTRTCYALPLAVAASPDIPVNAIGNTYLSDGHVLL